MKNQGDNSINIPQCQKVDSKSILWLSGESRERCHLVAGECHGTANNNKELFDFWNYVHVSVW